MARPLNLPVPPAGAAKPADGACCPAMQALKDTIFDEFVVAHTVGWWGKALFLRDTKMLWTIRCWLCGVWQ